MPLQLLPWVATSSSTCWDLKGSLLNLPSVMETRVDGFTCKAESHGKGCWVMALAARNSELLDASWLFLGLPLPFLGRSRCLLDVVPPLSSASWLDALGSAITGGPLLGDVTAAPFWDLRSCFFFSFPFLFLLPASCSVLWFCSSVWETLSESDRLVTLSAVATSATAL